MEKDKITNHIKISVACLVVAFICASWVFGSFNHSDVNIDLKLNALVITSTVILFANYFYWNSYQKKGKDSDEIRNSRNSSNDDFYDDL